MKDRKLYVMVIFFIIVLFFGGILIQQLIGDSHKQNEEKTEEQEIPTEENEEVQKPSIDEEPNSSSNNTDIDNDVNEENNKGQGVQKPSDNSQNSSSNNTSSNNTNVGNNTNIENNKEQEVQKPSDNNQNNSSSSNDNVNNEKEEQLGQIPSVDDKINSSDDQSSSDNNTNNEEQEVPTQEEINNTYRNELQNKYGVRIAYGNEMGNYSATGANLTKMIDPNTISEYLKKVDSVLSLYPSGFFKEIINFNMPLTIYLVEAVENGQYAGLLDSQFMNDIKLTIKRDGLFERTLHHELFHYIDAYLSVKMYPDNVEYSWNNLNPEGYSYGTVISSYTFNMVTNAPGAYFINDYSQTNYREDRATLFADMMTRVLKKSYMNEGEPILIKMRRIAEELDIYFSTVNSINKEYWERLIY